MAESSSDENLRNLALLFLSLAHGADAYLSDAELNAVVRQLEGKFGATDPGPSIRDTVMESLAVYADAEDPLAIATEAMLSLRSSLSNEERTQFLEVLSHVARADGVVFQDERGILASLANCWGIHLDEDLKAQPVASSTDAARSDEVFQDLAFIYLMLGHGTDYELSQSETQMMLRRLEEWQPHMDAEQIRAVLEHAMNRYAAGPTEDALTTAIGAVKRRLPPEQRMAALHDLIKIANADGVFLDDEEDLINRLLNEWEVDPYANYGSHGTKKGGSA